MKQASQARSNDGAAAVGVAAVVVVVLLLLVCLIGRFGWLVSRSIRVHVSHFQSGNDAQNALGGGGRDRWEEEGEFLGGAGRAGDGLAGAAAVAAEEEGEGRAAEGAGVLVAAVFAAAGGGVGGLPIVVVGLVGLRKG